MTKVNYGGARRNMNRNDLLEHFDYSEASSEVLDNARDIYDSNGVEQIDGSNFVVHGNSDYEVTLDRKEKTVWCTCKGCQNYNYCKHSIATAYFIEKSDEYDDSAPVKKITDEDLKRIPKKDKYVYTPTKEMQARIDMINKSPNSKIDSLHKSIPTLEISYDMYLPIPMGNYVEVDSEIAMLKKSIEKGLPFLIEGDKGIGKTLFVNTVCCMEDIPMVSYSCSSGTTMGDILGREHILGDDSVFELGLLPTAIEVANHFSKGILYLDELNALEPEIQKMLNSVIDARRSVTVNGHIYRLKDGVKFCIVATMNPSTYAGTSPLNEDLRSRFIGEQWRYPSGKHLSVVCNWDGITKESQKMILQLATDTLGMRQKGEISYVLSTRDIDMFTNTYRAWKEMGLKGDELMTKTLRTSVLIKFGDAEDRDAVRIRAEETFGVRMPLD